jgi:hypothetical protein
MAHMTAQEGVRWYGSWGQGTWKVCGECKGVQTEGVEFMDGVWAWMLLGSTVQGELPHFGYPAGLEGSRMCVGYQAVSKPGVVGKGLGGCYSFGVLWMCCMVSVQCMQCGHRRALLDRL